MTFAQNRQDRVNADKHASDLKLLHLYFNTTFSKIFVYLLVIHDNYGIIYSKSEQLAKKISTCTSTILQKFLHYEKNSGLFALQFFLRFPVIQHFCVSTGSSAVARLGQNITLQWSI